MRKELAKIEDVRCSFSATFARTGTKTSYGYTKQTVLLVDVLDSDGCPVTDHLWFSLTKGFQAVGLVAGDKVRFEARVKRYVKGYQGRRDVFDRPVELDYKLSYPTKLEKIQKEGEHV